MKPKKNAGLPFTSFRIIGEKAQKLLNRAKKLQGGEPKRHSRLPLPERHEELLVHISVESVVKATFAVLAIILGAVLIFFIQETIVVVLLATFVAAVIDPGVQSLRRVGLPRGLGILLHYFLFLFLFLFLIISLIPIIAKQLTDIADLINEKANAFLADPSISLPLLTHDVNAWLTNFVANTLRNQSIDRFADALQRVGQNLSATPENSLLLAAHLAGSVVNFFVNLVLVLVIAFFVQLEKERIIAWIRGFLPWRYRSYVDDKSEIIQWKLAQWARGQLLLCVSIGLLVFLALTILRMPYALTLAILAGFTEFIPVIGPFIAAVPAILIGTTEQGFLFGLIIAVVYYVIQWCENNLLVPLIMKRAVGLSPVAIMIAMLVAVSFPNVIHPVLGIILSIPLTTIITLFLEDWRAMPERKR